MSAALDQIDRLSIDADLSICVDTHQLELVANGLNACIHVANWYSAWRLLRDNNPLSGHTSNFHLVRQISHKLGLQCRFYVREQLVFTIPRPPDSRETLVTPRIHFMGVLRSLLNV